MSSLKNLNINFKMALCLKLIDFSTCFPKMTLLDGMVVYLEGMLSRIMFVFFFWGCFQKWNPCNQKRGFPDPSTTGRSDVLTRNSVMCDPKTNQHVLIFPSNSSKTLMPTATDHFTQTTLTLVHNQQILIIKI